MNYRHAFHAGNFADVFKHAVLARILVHLRQKEQPFRVIDTHAGAGLYNLEGEEAQRTGEWRDGIGRLATAALPPEAHALLVPYLDAIGCYNPSGHLKAYPGSPLIALALMRGQDKLIACELHPEAVTVLSACLRGEPRAKAIEIDGWVALNAYVPPPERRGVVLNDPPYEEKDEFARAARAVLSAHRKWATGIYVLWYPIKNRAGPDALAHALRKSGTPKVLRVELNPRGGEEAGPLRGAGLIIINPPWRLADELAVLLPVLAKACAPAAERGFALDWIARETRTG